MSKLLFFIHIYIYIYIIVRWVIWYRPCVSRDTGVCCKPCVYNIIRVPYGHTVYYKCIPGGEGKWKKKKNPNKVRAYRPRIVEIDHREDVVYLLQETQTGQPGLHSSIVRTPGLPFFPLRPSSPSSAAAPILCGEPWRAYI